MLNDAEILRALFDVALNAALPEGKFDGRLPPKPYGRTIVLGAGKASARMATAFEEAWTRAGGTCEGLVVNAREVGAYFKKAIADAVGHNRFVGEGPRRRADGSRRVRARPRRPRLLRCFREGWRASRPPSWREV